METRSKSKKSEEQGMESTDMMQMLQALMLKIEKGQDSLEDIKKEMKKGQDDMKEMKKGQDDMKEEMKKGQDDLTTKITCMEESVRKGQEELTQRLEETTKQIEDIKKDQENFKSELQEDVKKVVQDLKENQEVLKEEIKEEVKKEVCQELLISNSKIREELQLELEHKTEGLHEEIRVLRQQITTGGGSVRIEPSANLKPPCFDGQVSWTTYAKQFEAAAKANNWSPREKVTSLILSLRGEATDVLRTLPEEKQENYEELVKAFEMRYGESHLQQVYQAQLKTRRQKFGESLQQYQADIARLANLAYPNAPDNFYQHFTVSCFIDGLYDQDTQQALRLAQCKNLSDALARALEYEAAKQSSRSANRVRRVRIDEDLGDGKLEEKVTKAIEGLVGALQEQHNQRRPSSTIKCWQCGKEGHVRSRCRNAA